MARAALGVVVSVVELLLPMQARTGTQTGGDEEKALAGRSAALEEMPAFAIGLAPGRGSATE